MHKREFRSLICSMLLGDGHLTSDKYIMNHSNQQRDYANWKAELINNIFRDKDIPKRCVFMNTSKYDKKYNKTYHGVRVQFSWADYFKHLRKKCYKMVEGKPVKDVEYLLSNVSSPLHLAIWLADDGREHRHKNTRGTRHVRKYINPFYSICCYSFTEGQCNLVSQWLINNYGVSPRIIYDKCRGKNGYSIRFLSADSKKLFQLLYPFFEQIPSIKQKFWLSFERYLPNKENPDSGDDIVQTTTQFVAQETESSR